MQSGIETDCHPPQVYVGQFPPSEDSTGCEHRVIVRSADEGVSYVQVVAICKYSAVCCDESVKNVKYAIEGSVAGSNTPPPDMSGNPGAAIDKQPKK